MRMLIPSALLVVLGLMPPSLAPAQSPSAGDRFTLRDVFELEAATQPAIAPDGSKIVFARFGYDIMKDHGRTALWTIDADGRNLRPLLDPGRSASSPRFSPDGSRLAFVAASEGKPQIFVRWMDSGQEAALTHLTEAPGALAWSPDGQWIAFSMFVPDDPAPFVQLPPMPEGADWGPPIKFIDRLNYRGDGAGYLRRGYRHLFVLPVEGGTPRQLTDGPFDDGAPEWAPDGKALLFSANRHPEGEYDPNDSEVYEVALAGGPVRALTTRHGPDQEPTVSPDGALVAYTGFDDRYQGYQVTRLSVMNRDGSGSRVVSGKLDRDVGNLTWSRDGKGLFVQYDDQGDTKIGYLTLSGDLTELAKGVGGLDLGRPYSGGSYAVAPTGRFVFTQTAPDHPADLAVGARGEPVRRITRLNDDSSPPRSLGPVEEIWWQSSFDQRRIQGWIVKPPGLRRRARSTRWCWRSTAGRSPTTASGSPSEIQLYAAAGYVVLYTNPRG